MSPEEWTFIAIQTHYGSVVIKLKNKGCLVKKCTREDVEVFGEPAVSCCYWRVQNKIIPTFFVKMTFLWFSFLFQTFTIFYYSVLNVYYNAMNWYLNISWRTIHVSTQEMFSVFSHYSTYIWCYFVVADISLTLTVSCFPKREVSKEIHMIMGNKMVHISLTD